MCIIIGDVHQYGVHCFILLCPWNIWYLQHIPRRKVTRHITGSRDKTCVISVKPYLPWTRLNWINGLIKCSGNLVKWIYYYLDKTSDFMFSKKLKITNLPLPTVLPHPQPLTYSNWMNELANKLDDQTFWLHYNCPNYSC